MKDARKMAALIEGIVEHLEDNIKIELDRLAKAADGGRSINRPRRDLDVYDSVACLRFFRDLTDYAINALEGAVTRERDEARACILDGNCREEARVRWIMNACDSILEEGDK